MKKIKIAIDISPLNDGNSVRGVGHYTQNLIAGLKHEISTNPKYADKYQIDLITNSSLLNTNYSLIHYPYFDPFFLTLPAKKTNQKRLVTVHDLIPRQYQSRFPVGLKGELKWQIQKYNLKKSDYIITVSHYSKNVIADILNYPADRIFVTYEAAGPDFKPRRRQTLATVRKKYNLPEKFILYVGDINWNKNIPSLVEACVDLQYHLVIAGSAAVKTNIPHHPWTQDILKVQKLISQNPKLIIPTGFVPDTDVPLLFNLATIYCQPSYAEGFGLPLVEAMQSGTPVAYSQDSCLNEIMDYNGQMFDPNQPDQIKNSLKLLWENSKLRTKYSQSGIIRATNFSWQFTALETLAVYDLCFV